MKYLKAMILLVIITTIATGCTSPESENNTTNNEKTTIYSTVYPIQYAIERIGGEDVAVESVYPPGVDAHTYEPTSKDMTDMAKSDAFIYLGHGMEAFAETAADALKNQEVELIELGNNEDLFHKDEDNHGHSQELEHDGHNHGDYDPHIWIDPLRMLELSEIIKTELVKLTPESESMYNENFEKLKQDLLKLDNDFTKTLEGKDNKKILVTHAAYGYWDERYGLEQIAINKSTGSEPSQKELTNVIDLAKENKLTYVISEQNRSNRLTEVIQNEINADEVTVHNLSVLTEDDLSNNEDYLSLMYGNLKTLDLVTE